MSYSNFNVGQFLTLSSIHDTTKLKNSLIYRKSISKYINKYQNYIIQDYSDNVILKYNLIHKYTNTQWFKEYDFRLIDILRTYDPSMFPFLKEGIQN